MLPDPFLADHLDCSTFSAKFRKNKPCSGVLISEVEGYSSFALLSKIWKEEYSWFLPSLLWESNYRKATDGLY